MGPYGSVWADIKTGKSPMAHDHFQTPPDPKRGHKNTKKLQKSLKVRAKPAKSLMNLFCVKQWPEFVPHACTRPEFALHFAS